MGSFQDTLGWRLAQAAAKARAIDEQSARIASSQQAANEKILEAGTKLNTRRQDAAKMLGEAGLPLVEGATPAEQSYAALGAAIVQAKLKEQQRKEAVAGQILAAKQQAAEELQGLRDAGAMERVDVNNTAAMDRLMQRIQSGAFSFPTDTPSDRASRAAIGAANTRLSSLESTIRSLETKKATVIRSSDRAALDKQIDEAKAEQVKLRAQLGLAVDEMRKRHGMPSSWGETAPVPGGSSTNEARRRHGVSSSWEETAPIPEEVDTNPVVTGDPLIDELLRGE